ncbi:MAG: hypothetical protein E6I81_00655 [Chloroflexi bacterium]|nr:MAG: hypothetical protein E6I81_00655 [Chloroflexota bacterium]
MKAILLAALLLMAVACGQVQGKPTSTVVSPITTPTATAGAQPSATPAGSPGASPATSPLPVPKTSPTLLFAVLEASGTANSWSYNTVAIAGVDGYARAKTTFTPMPVPSVGCMGAIIPPSAHVAAGKVFYADAKGVIRSLSIDGTVRTAADFHMTSTQQMLSFAVSPDGTRLLGTVYTIPTNAFSCDGSQATSPFAFDAYSASNGGTSQLLYHQSWTKPQNVLALTGWDEVGPVGTDPTVWASQGGGPGSTLGVLVRIDPLTAKVLKTFSNPSSCMAWGSVASGAFVCTGDSTITGGGTPQQNVVEPVSVRQADGTELWHFTASGATAPSSPVLAPDGQHVMMCCANDGSGGFGELVIGRDGSRVALARGLYGSAWLDSSTYAGDFNTDPLKLPPFPLAYVAASAPASANSMGFSGLVVGTVRP